MRTIAKLWNIDKGDFSQLGEKIEFFGSLRQTEKSLFEVSTGARSMDILARFQELFPDAQGRLGGRIESMNKRITDPGNEFMQAEIMSTLVNAKP